jgi:hypothetical protein
MGVRLEAVGLASRARNLRAEGAISDEQKGELRGKVIEIQNDLSKIDAAASEEARKDAETALAEVLEIIR